MSATMCVHSIPMRRSCPWCKRKGDAAYQLRQIKKPWQFYQELFTNFLSDMKHEVHGPIAVSFAIMDMNGKAYSCVHGEVQDIEDLLQDLRHSLNTEKERLQNAPLTN